MNHSTMNPLSHLNHVLQRLAGRARDGESDAGQRPAAVRRGRSVALRRRGRLHGDGSRTCLISDVSHLGRVGDVSGDGVGDVSGTCLISPLRRR